MASYEACIIPSLTEDLLHLATAKSEKCITTITELVVVWSVCSTRVSQWFLVLVATVAHATLDAFASDVARSCKTAVLYTGRLLLFTIDFVAMIKMDNYKRL